MSFLPLPPLGHLRRTFASVLLVGFALVCLTGCGSKGPENKLIKRAIAFQYEQSQVALSQHLHTQPEKGKIKFKIERISVDERTPMRIKGRSSFRIQGHYDASVKFPGKRYHQKGNPFDIYLQQQGDGENTIWRVAIPQKTKQGNTQQWKSYLLFDPLAESV